MLQLLVPPLSKVEHDHTYAQPVYLEPGTCTYIHVEKETVNSELTLVEKEQVKRELNVTILDRQEIEHSTRQQSHSQLWQQVRARQITVSKCGRIICMKHYTENLLKSILYPGQMIFVPKPIEWGRENEERAKVAYAGP